MRYISLILTSFLLLFSIACGEDDPEQLNSIDASTPVNIQDSGIQASYTDVGTEAGTFSALMPSTDPEIESRCFVSRGSVQLDTIPQQIGDRIAGSYSFTRYSSGQRCATASGTFSAILHLPLSE